MADIETRVRKIIAESSRIICPPGGLDDDSNLWDLGMDSIENIRLVVSIEDEFDIEFPDSMLSRATFSRVSSIVSGIALVLGV